MKFVISWFAMYNFCVGWNALLNCHKKRTMNIVNSSVHHDAMCLALRLQLANNVTALVL